MRAVVQRVRSARVEVDGRVVGEVGLGLCAFVGAGKGDDEGDIAWLADKIASLRIFSDDAGRMNLSVGEAGGGVLVVSQFTLYGDVRRGRRPGFDAAMEPEGARRACDEVVRLLCAKGLAVATGQFAAHMRVVVDNDGPVTILVDSKKQF